MSNDREPRSSREIVDEYYAKHYASVHGSGCLGTAASVLHRRLEHRRGPGRRYPVTVEVGAGRFEHLPYVQHQYDRYVATDLRVPVENPTYVELTNGSGPPGLEFVQMDALQLGFEDHSVDRLVASCLLIHLPDPLAAVQEWQRVCRPTGVIDILVPCDPGLLARAFRRTVSQRTARRQGVDPSEYVLVNAIEHLSPFNRVLTLTRAAIEPNRRLSVSYYPFAVVPAWNVNAFAILSIGAA